MARSKKDRSLRILNRTGGGAGGGSLETPNTNIETSPVNTATSSTNVTLTAAASAHVKGTYTEVVASTAAATTAIIISFPNHTLNSDGRYLIDIATGAAASETIIIPNFIAWTTDQSGTAGMTTLLPVSIPAGTRISARCQCSTANSTLDVQVLLLQGGAATAGTYTQHGVDTASTNGQIITYGSSNTKTSYTEMDAGVASDIDVLYVLCSPRDTNAVEQQHLLDIATGGAGSETVLIGDIAFSQNNIDDNDMYVFGPIPVSIPAGTRLAVRGQCSASASTSMRVQLMSLSFS